VGCSGIPNSGPRTPTSKRGHHRPLRHRQRQQFLILGPDDERRPWRSTRSHPTSSRADSSATRSRCPDRPGWCRPTRGPTHPWIVPVPGSTSSSTTSGRGHWRQLPRRAVLSRTRPRRPPAGGAPARRSAPREMSVTSTDPSGSLASYGHGWPGEATIGRYTQHRMPRDNRRYARSRSTDPHRRNRRIRQVRDGAAHQLSADACGAGTPFSAAAGDEHRAASVALRTFGLRCWRPPGEAARQQQRIGFLGDRPAVDVKRTPT
jgi:hypothetical protein